MMAVAFWAAALAVVGWVAAMAVVGWVAVTVASAAPSLPAPARGRAQATRRTGQGQPGGVAQSFGRRDRVLALEMGRQAPAAGACVRGRPEVAITGHLREGTSSGRHTVGDPSRRSFVRFLTPSKVLLKQLRGHQAAAV